jgi:TonB family protein
MKSAVGNFGMRRARRTEWLALIAVLAFAGISPAFAAENLTPHAVADRSGEVATTPKQTLRLIADLGSVTIQTLPASASPVVRYAVHIETDAREPVAQAFLDHYMISAHSSPTGVNITGSLPSLGHNPQGRNAQFWVTFVVSVPIDYNVEVTTGAGDIETPDLLGHIVLNTEGGNIRTGRVGVAGQAAGTLDHPLAKIITRGGHITVADVYGNLDAFTAGGHIVAGNVDGSAKLHTGGGHIRAGKIRGAADLDTAGGNITVGEADAMLSVRTGGGQIDLGEIHGSIHAQTAGGGIRAMYIAGPMEMETNGGSICLTRVANTVRAYAGSGTITAWITPESGNSGRPATLSGPSQLSSSTGDIIVFLPRNLAATIDASVENGSPAKIEADPSLPLTVQSQSDGAGSVHAIGLLNGGGAVLKLHTTAGKIRLQFVDSQNALRESLEEEQKMRLDRKLNDVGVEQVTLRTAMPSEQPSATPAEDKRDWLDLVMDRLEVAVTGGVREDPEEFKKRIVNCCKSPEYPLIAKRAGLQGIVRLQIRVKPDGSVSVDKVLEGQPALADAASTAVRQWKATPGELSGKKVDVISTVTFNFQLH